MKKINLANNLKTQLSKLSIGDRVLLSGDILTARDASCLRMVAQEQLPEFLRNQLLFFCGPSPTPPCKIIGSCGPTTTSRMQPFFESLFRAGVIGLIGKGEIDSEYINLFKQYESVLFSVTGGIGALLASKVESAQIIAFEDLGPEAIWQLNVQDIPAIVMIDVS